MRFVSYLYKETSSWGVLDGRDIIDLSHTAASMKEAIEKNRLPHSIEQASGEKAPLSLDQVSLLPPVTNPTRILCVGQNYVAHRDEMGGATTTHPLIFTRYPSSIVGHQQDIIKPAESGQFDYEGELAVIIGKRGRRITAGSALEHIAGYSCFMDGSARDFQVHTTQYIPGKNFDESGSFGPWMLASSAMPEPNSGITLETRLNDELVQQTTTDLMIFDVPAIIAYLSTFTTLEPGDVIATGTPGGVGYKRDPQLFMKAGDKIEVTIEGLATLSNVVRD